MNFAIAIIALALVSPVYGNVFGNGVTVDGTHMTVNCTELDDNTIIKESDTNKGRITTIIGGNLSASSYTGLGSEGAAGNFHCNVGLNSQTGYKLDEEANLDDQKDQCFKFCVTHGQNAPDANHALLWDWEFRWVEAKPIESMHYSTTKCYCNSNTCDTASKQGNSNSYYAYSLDVVYPVWHPVTQLTFENCETLTDIGYYLRTLNPDPYHYVIRNGYSVRVYKYDNPFQYAELTTLTIPDSVIWISPWAFGGDEPETTVYPMGSRNTLKTLHAGSGMFINETEYKNWQDRRFIKAASWNYQWDAYVTRRPFNKHTAIETLTISEGSQYIPRWAFTYIPMTSITFPNSLTKIDNEAFYDAKFRSLTLPPNVEYIGNKAFFRSFNMILNIPSSLTIVGWDAFGYYNEKCVSAIYEHRNNWTGVDKICINQFGSPSFGGPSNCSDYTCPEHTSRLYRATECANENSCTVSECCGVPFVPSLETFDGSLSEAQVSELQTEISAAMTLQNGQCKF